MTDIGRGMSRTTAPTRDPEVCESRFRARLRGRLPMSFAEGCHSAWDPNADRRMRTGDGAIVEFRSVVDAVNCAIEVQRAMVERNAGVASDSASNFGSASISATWSRKPMAT